MAESDLYDVPMSSPDITDAERKAVMNVLHTPNLSIGPQIEAFEKRVAEYVGATEAVGVNSGTAGLHLCVRAAGIGSGDLVITTPFSFVASSNVLLYENAIPVFVDVDPLTGNIRPDGVAEAARDLAAGGRAARKMAAAQGCRECGKAQSCPGSGRVWSACGLRCPPSNHRPV